MAKIFELDFRKGTLIDSVSKTAGTLTAGNGGFKKTEKGLALYGDGSATQIVTDSTLPFAYTDTFTFETTIKILDTDGGYIFSNATSGGFGLYVTSAMNYKMFNGVADTTSASTTLKMGKWYHIVGVYSNGTINYYLNNSADGTVSFGYSFAASTTKLNLLNRPGGSSGGTLFKGYLGIVRFYNTALTTAEINELYKEFLNSSPTEKDIRGFEYPKPTDLSKEDGLVAAYSFSPQTVSSGTLIDISGNGNHGTISGALLTKEGMKFDGVDDKISVGSINLGTVHTTCARFKLGSLSDGFKCIFGSISTSAYTALIKPNTKLIYYRDGSNNTTQSWTADLLEHTLVIARNGTSISFYIDGNLLGAQTSASNNAMDLSWTIGAMSNSLYWNNDINDLRIYNYAFTPQQAQAYHNSFIKPVLIESFENYAVGDTL